MRFAIFFPIVLAGCAGLVQVGSPGQDPVPTFVAGGAEPGNTLIIYRPSEIGFIPNVGTAPEVTLNGESVGNCRVGSPLVLRVPDGNWRVGTRSGTRSIDQTIEVSQGSTRYFICGTEATPSLAPAPVLEPVENSTGSKEAGL